MLSLLMRIVKLQGYFAVIERDIWYTLNITIVGDVLYDGVPLNGWNSDLTAIFYLKKVDKNYMTLCFQDLHVM